MRKPFCRPLANAQEANALRRRELTRFLSGAVVSIAAGRVEVDVGCTLPDGTAQNLWMPVAVGFTPFVGQTVEIAYDNGSLRPYAVAVGHSSDVDPLTTAQATSCLSFHVPSVGAGVTVATKQAATKNKLATELAIEDITVFAAAIAGSPKVDIYEGASSILSVQTTLSAATVHELSIGDACIAADAELSVRCVTAGGESITGLSVHVWWRQPVF